MIRRTCLSAVIAAAAGAGAASAQTGECRLLAEMRRADAALAGLTPDRPEAAAALFASLVRVRRAAMAADLSDSVPGLTPDLVDDFLLARQVALATGAVPREAALASTVARLAPIEAALSCTTEGREAQAGADGPGSDRMTRAGASGATAPRGTAGLGAARAASPASALRPGREVRLAPKPRDIWVMVSVFLLVFAATVTILNRVRRGLRRRQRRFPCVLDVALWVDAASRPARLIDLSRTGGKLRIESPPEVGARLSLRWHEVDLEARIVWANAHFAGFRFRRILPRRTCSRLLDAGRPAPERNAPVRRDAA